MADPTTAPASPETAPATAPAPDPTPDWRAALPDELRAEKSLEQIKARDAAEALPLLAKGYVNAQRLVGPKVPEGLTAEKVNEFLSRQREEPPPSWDKYEGVDPEGVAFDSEARASFLRDMHKAGVPASHVKAAMAWYAGWAKEAQAKQEANTAKAQREREDAALRELQKEWGPQGSRDFQLNMGFAKLALDKATEAGVLRNQDEAEAANEACLNPLVVRLFKWFGEQLTEGGHVGGDELGGPSDDDLESEIERVRTEAAKLQTGPAYDALIDKLEKLYERAGRRAARKKAVEAA